MEKKNRSAWTNDGKQKDATQTSNPVEYIYSIPARDPRIPRYKKVTNLHDTFCVVVVSTTHTHTTFVWLLLILVSHTEFFPFKYLILSRASILYHITSTGGKPEKVLDLIPSLVPLEASRCMTLDVSRVKCASTNAISVHETMLCVLGVLPMRPRFLPRALLSFASLFLLADLTHSLLRLNRIMSITNAASKDTAAIQQSARRMVS